MGEFSDELEFDFEDEDKEEEELEEPEVISSTRVDRICKGSGRKPSEVRELLKQYKESKKLVKVMKGMGAGSPNQMKKLMSKFKGKMPGM